MSVQSTLKGCHSKLVFGVLCAVAIVPSYETLFDALGVARSQVRATWSTRLKKASSVCIVRSAGAKTTSSLVFSPPGEGDLGNIVPAARTGFPDETNAHSVRNRFVDTVTRVERQVGRRR